MVDALASGASVRKGVEVRLLFPAPVNICRSTAAFSFHTIRPVGLHLIEIESIR